MLSRQWEQTPRSPSPLELEVVLLLSEKGLSLSSTDTKSQMLQAQNIWNHLANSGIILMMSLKVWRSILIQEQLFYRTKVKECHIKTQPLLEYCVQQEKGRICLRGITLYFYHLLKHSCVKFILLDRKIH